MNIQRGQNGFILFLLLVIVAIVSIMIYTFIKTKAREQGIELTF